MKHPDYMELLRYISGGSSAGSRAEIEKHAVKCPECDQRIKALKYLRENFDSIWNSWSAADHGRIFKNMKIAEKLADSKEKGQIPATLAEACIKRLNEGGGILFNILLAGAKRIASAAAAPAANGFRYVLKPAVAGVASPEAVETEAKIKAGSSFLGSGRTDKAVGILEEVVKIDARAVRSATLDIFRDDRLSLRLVADSGKQSVSVVQWKNVGLVPFQAVILIPGRPDYKMRAAEFQQVDGADYLLAEITDLSDGEYTVAGV